MGCASGSSLSAPHPTLFRRQRCPTRPPLRIAPRITACERADEKFDLGQRTLGPTRGRRTLYNSRQSGKAPHGVIGGPDGAAWATEAGRTRAAESRQNKG